jgi:hypothetical protein
MVVLGEKLGGEPVDWSSGVLGIVSGALFLGSSRVRPTLLIASKWLSRTWTAHRKRTCDVRGLGREAYVSCVSGFTLQGVHRFELPRLGYGYRLFTAVSM